MTGLRDIPPFALERYFARWEFAVKHVLGASDVEGWPLQELLDLADEDARARWDRLTLGYTESSGLPALREEIARDYGSLAADDVLVFAGAEEAIFLAVQAMLSRGDHAVVVVPAYQSLHTIARAAGAQVTMVPLAAADWSLDLDAVRAAITPRTRLIVVNFPHSPTGALIDRATLEAIAALAEQHDAWLLSDEVYRGLELDAAARLPCAADLTARAVSLGVMSKTYALAGLRIGWIATRDAALRMRLATLKDYTTICNAAPSEVLALIALRARERVIERSMSIIRANLPEVEAFMRRQCDRLEWVPPRAGSVAFPRLRFEDAERFADVLVREAGVLLLPGSLFDMPGGHFRIGLGRRDLPEALARLEEFMTTHPRIDASVGQVAGISSVR